MVDFSLQRDSYAKRGICRRRVSVRLSVGVWVCVSVTLRYCMKTAKHRITQIMLHDRSGTQVYNPCSKSTVMKAKIGHVNITTPLLGVICHLFGKT